MREWAKSRSGWCKKNFALQVDKIKAPPRPWVELPLAPLTERTRGPASECWLPRRMSFRRTRWDTACSSPTETSPAKKLALSLPGGLSPK
jgi:hypothetical protein